MRTVEFTVLLDRFWDQVSELAGALQIRESEATGAMLRFWGTWKKKQLKGIVERERQRAKRDGDRPMPMVCVSASDFGWRWKMTVGGGETVPPIEIFESCGFLHKMGEDQWRVCGMSMRLGYYLERHERDEIDDYFTRVADTDWHRAEQLVTDHGPTLSRARCAAIGSLAWWRRYIATKERLELAHMEAFHAGHIKPVVRVTESELMRIWKMVSRDTLVADIGIDELAAAQLIDDPRVDERGRRQWAVSCMDDSGELVTYAIRQKKRMDGFRSREHQLTGQMSLPGHSGRSPAEYEYFRRYIEPNKIRRKVFVPKENSSKCEVKQITFGQENLTKKGRMSADQDLDKDLTTTEHVLDHELRSGGDRGESPGPRGPSQKKTHNVGHERVGATKYRWRTEVSDLASKMASVFQAVTGGGYLLGIPDMKAISRFINENPLVGVPEILRTWETGLRSTQFPKIRNIFEILMSKHWNYYAGNSGGAPTARAQAQAQSPEPSPELAGGRISGPIGVDQAEARGESPEASQSNCGPAEAQADEAMASEVRAAHAKARSAVEAISKIEERQHQCEEKFQAKLEEGGGWSRAHEKIAGTQRKLAGRANRIWRALEAFGAAGNGNSDAMLALAGAPRTAAVVALDRWQRTTSASTKGRGILLFGPKGTGKSFAARRFALAAHREELSQRSATENSVGVEHNSRSRSMEPPPMRLRYVAQMVQATSCSGRGNFKEYDRDFWSNLREVPTLLIDDLGKEYVNRVWHQNLWELLDARLGFGERTIITSNLAPDELEAKYGGAIFERLIALCQCVHVLGCARFEVVQPKVNEGNLRAALRGAA